MTLALALSSIVLGLVLLWAAIHGKSATDLLAPYFGADAPGRQTPGLVTA